MAEAFPIAAGLLMGALVAAYVPIRARRAIFAVAAIVIAVVAGLISGELARSAGFLLVDLPEAVLAGLVGVTLTRRALAADAR